MSGKEDWITDETTDPPIDLEQARRWRLEIETRMAEVEARLKRLEAELTLRLLGEE